VLAFDDGDIHHAADAGQLTGAGIGHHHNHQMLNAAPHDAGMQQRETAFAPMQLANHALNRNIARRALDWGRHAEHFARAGGFQVAVVVLIDRQAPERAEVIVHADFGGNLGVDDLRGELDFKGTGSVHGACFGLFNRMTNIADLDRLLGGYFAHPPPQNLKRAFPVTSNLSNHPRWDAAIVDLDGTLVDTLGDFEEALRRTLGELDFQPVPRAFIERTVGKGTEHLILRTLQQIGANESHYDAAWAGYHRHYSDINGQYAQVYPGVPEGLRALRQAGLRLACVTNKPGQFAQPLLAQKELASYFEQIYGGDAFAHKKPDPLPLLKACEALGTTPARTLVIGDSSNDVQAARAAGCPVLLVAYGYNHGEPAAQAGADGVLVSLADLSQML